jgi:hypothetical protein
VSGDEIFAAHRPFPVQVCPRPVARWSTGLVTRVAGLAARLVAVDPEPDTPPTLSGTVVAQQPRPGERIPAGDTVTIWIEGDDGGGGGKPQPDTPSPLDPAGVK